MLNFIEKTALGRRTLKEADKLSNDFEDQIAEIIAFQNETMAKQDEGKQ